MDSKTLCQANMIQEQIEEITDTLDIWESVNIYPCSHNNKDIKFLELLSFTAACTVKSIVIADLKSNLGKLEKRFKSL